MLTIETDGGGIAVVTLDAPDRTMNVLDWAMADALEDAAISLAADDAVRGVVLTSGKAGFVAGGDLAAIKELGRLSAADAAHRIRRFSDVFRRIETLGKPVVAAAPGTALGGGLELMLACHHRIAAAGERSVFGFPEVGLGLVPGAGGTQRLPRLIGMEAALPILMNPAPMAADKALAVGILDAVVAPEELVPAAKQALADGRVSATVAWDERGFRPPGLDPGALAGFNFFAAANAALVRDTSPAYPAPQAILSCVYEGIRLPIDRALALETQYFGRLVTGAVAQALIDLRFFARQRAAGHGFRKPANDAPLAVLCREAMADAARHLAETGVPANRINTALRQFDISIPPLAAGPVGDAAPVEADVLRGLARQILIAGALAVAGDEPDDADVADITAVEQGGFPAWTSGPLAFLDREGIEALTREAGASGIAVPPSVASLAASHAPFAERRSRA